MGKLILNNMKTAEQNNRMIAEFMGGKYNGETSFNINLDEIWLPFHGVCKLHDNGKRLKYHTSWDWLMPVVEKIESLGFSVEVVKHICRINLSSDANIVVSENIPKIKATYQAVCQFIEWYNENK